MQCGGLSLLETGGMGAWRAGDSLLGHVSANGFLGWALTKCLTLLLCHSKGSLPKPGRGHCFWEQPFMHVGHA